METTQETAKPDLNRLDEVLARYQGQKWPLIPLLQEVQDELGYIPPETIGLIARATGLFPAQVQGVITFYEQFHTTPRGKNIVRVCRGTACHVRGATRVLDKVQDLTGIKPGESDTELKFSLDTVNCLGCCALGPVMEINGKTHGKLSPANTEDVINSYE